MLSTQTHLLPHWTIKGEKKLSPFLLAGIVNCTPDSFSNTVAEKEIPHAQIMQEHIAAGAHILDLGAESTRPNAPPVTAQEEWSRLQKTLSLAFALQKNYPTVVISVDTYKAKTAKQALDAGVEIINDISGGTLDANMLDIIADYKPGFVLGHCPVPPQTMQKRPQYKNVIMSVYSHFESTMNALVQKGLPEEYIALDPCIGFAKTTEHNLTILQHLPIFLPLGRPLYLGLSRKNMLGVITGMPIDARDTATAISTALLATKGAAIFRVHNVALSKNALDLATAFTPTLISS